MGPLGFEISKADKNKKEKECQCFMGPFGFEISEADQNTKEKECQRFALLLFDKKIGKFSIL
jgi:uncharacterized tellurite resistance protein B-like protein